MRRSWDATEDIERETDRNVRLQGQKIAAHDKSTLGFAAHKPYPEFGPKEFHLVPGALGNIH